MRGGEGEREMATTSSKNNMKGFYRQKKKTGAITKKTSNKKTPKISATFGSDVNQPTALISHGSLDLKGPFFFRKKKPLSLCIL